MPEDLNSIFRAQGGRKEPTLPKAAFHTHTDTRHMYTVIIYKVKLKSKIIEVSYAGAMAAIPHQASAITRQPQMSGILKRDPST